jgi:ubiquitin-protein ligase
MSSDFISSDTKKRIYADVKEIIQHPLTNHGIYYSHSEENILIGYALIIGPENTPYQWGNYLFKIKFSSSYPHEPPHVTYLTNDGNTRFNPNLYRNGKVCLSLLNTWRGEQWDGTQTLSSILLSLCTIFNEKPFLNEPDVTEKHKDCDAYHEAIEYKNYDTAIYRILDKTYLTPETSIMYEQICEKFFENYEKIMKNLERLCIEKKKKRLEVFFYNMFLNIDYEKIRTELKQLHNKLKKEKLK